MFLVRAHARAHTQAVCIVSTGVLSTFQHSGCRCAFPFGDHVRVFANSQMPFHQNTMMHVTFTRLGLCLHSPSFFASLGAISFLLVTGQGYEQLTPTGVCMLGWCHRPMGSFLSGEVPRELCHGTIVEAEGLSEPRKGRGREVIKPPMFTRTQVYKDANHHD